MRQVTVARSFRSQKPVAMGPCFRRDDIFLSQPPTASVSKSFKSAKIYSLKPAPKPPVTRANGDAVFSLNGPASLLPLIAGGRPPVTSIHRETFHVEAYCIVVRRRPRRAGADRHPCRARQRARQNDEERNVRREDRDGRRRRDVPLQEHHPERRQLEGSHHAGRRGEGRRPCLL